MGVSVTTYVGVVVVVSRQSREFERTVRVDNNGKEVGMFNPQTGEPSTVKTIMDTKRLYLDPDLNVEEGLVTPEDVKRFEEAGFKDGGKFFATDEEFMNETLFYFGYSSKYRLYDAGNVMEGDGGYVRLNVDADALVKEFEEEYAANIAYWKQLFGYVSVEFGVFSYASC